MTLNNTKKIQSNTNEPKEHEDDVPRRDRANMALLILLYGLQGIPVGVSAAIPMILASRNVNYTDQALYSFAVWPFTFKLLWAPALDSIYSLKFGRRKSWLIPAQYCIGLTMLYMAYSVDDWVSTSNGAKIQVIKLTVSFFILNFLSAVQDVAVDGWSLTILHRKNIGYAPTCNSIGRTSGYFCGFVLLTALESSNFCNTYLRSSPETTGVLTIADFLFYFSFIYIFITSLIGAFKRESSIFTQDISPQNSYLSLLRILKLPPVQWLTLICFTVHFANAATFSMMNLKLIEAGISQEKIALTALPLIPLELLTVFLISRWAAGSDGLLKFMYTLYLYLMYDVMNLIFLWYTPVLIKNGIPLYFWGLLLLNSYCEGVLFSSGLTTLVAFFAKVSDPTFGATYMTLLNTIFDFGTSWPRTLTLSIVGGITWRTCLFNSTVKNISQAVLTLNETNFYCLDDDEKRHCQDDGGVCKITFDGFFIFAPICVIIGLVWLILLKNKFYHLQNLDADKWALPKTCVNDIVCR